MTSFEIYTRISVEIYAEFQASTENFNAVYDDLPPFLGKGLLVAPNQAPVPWSLPAGSDLSTITVPASVPRDIDQSNIYTAHEILVSNSSQDPNANPCLESAPVISEALPSLVTGMTDTQGINFTMLDPSLQRFFSSDFVVTNSLVRIFRVSGDTSTTVWTGFVTSVSHNKISVTVSARNELKRFDQNADFGFTNEIPKWKVTDFKIPIISARVIPYSINVQRHSQQLVSYYDDWRRDYFELAQGRDVDRPAFPGSRSADSRARDLKDDRNINFDVKVGPTIGPNLATNFGDQSGITNDGKFLYIAYLNNADNYVMPIMDVTQTPKIAVNRVVLETKSNQDAITGITTYGSTFWAFYAGEVEAWNKSGSTLTRNSSKDFDITRPNDSNIIDATSDENYIYVLTHAVNDRNYKILRMNHSGQSVTTYNILPDDSPKHQGLCTDGTYLYVLEYIGINTDIAGENSSALQFQIVVWTNTGQRRKTLDFVISVDSTLDALPFKLTTDGDYLYIFFASFTTPAGVTHANNVYVWELPHIRQNRRDITISGNDYAGIAAGSAAGLDFRGMYVLENSANRVRLWGQLGAQNRTINLGAGTWAGITTNETVQDLRPNAGAKYLYALDDAKNTVKVWNIDESMEVREESRDIALGDGDWKGITVEALGDLLYALEATKNKVRVWNVNTLDREPLRDIDLIDATWHGVTTDGLYIYVLDDSSNNIRVWTIGGVRKTRLDTNVGSGDWRGLTTDKQYLYLCDARDDVIKVWALKDRFNLFDEKDAKKEAVKNYIATLTPNYVSYDPGILPKTFIQMEESGRLTFNRGIFILPSESDSPVLGDTIVEPLSHHSSNFRLGMAPVRSLRSGKVSIQTASQIIEDDPTGLGAPPTREPTRNREDEVELPTGDTTDGDSEGTGEGDEDAGTGTSVGLNYQGIAYTATHKYMLDNTNKKIIVYAFSTNNRLSDRDITLLSGGEYRGIDTDGTTIWALDNKADKLIAYKIADSTADTAKDVTLTEGDYTGVTIQGTDAKVIDLTDNKVKAWSLAGVRDTTKDIDLGRGDWAGISSNAGFVYVLDNLQKSINPYDNSSILKAQNVIGLDEENDQYTGTTILGEKITVMNNSKNRTEDYDLPAEFVKPPTTGSGIKGVGRNTALDVPIDVTPFGLTIDSDGNFYVYDSEEVHVYGSDKTKKSDKGFKIRYSDSSDKVISIARATNRYYVLTATGNVHVWEYSDSRRSDRRANRRLDLDWKTIANRDSVGIDVVGSTVYIFDDYIDDNGFTKMQTTAYSLDGARQSSSDIVLTVESSSWPNSSNFRSLRSYMDGTNVYALLERNTSGFRNRGQTVAAWDMDGDRVASKDFNASFRFVSDSFNFAVISNNLLVWKSSHLQGISAFNRSGDSVSASTFSLVLGNVINDAYRTNIENFTYHNNKYEMFFDDVTIDSGNADRVDVPRSQGFIECSTDGTLDANTAIPIGISSTSNSIGRKGNLFYFKTVDNQLSAFNADGTRIFSDDIYERTKATVTSETIASDGTNFVSFINRQDENDERSRVVVFDDEMDLVRRSNKSDIDVSGIDIKDNFVYLYDLDDNIKIWQYDTLIDPAGSFDIDFGTDQVEIASLALNNDASKLWLGVNNRTTSQKFLAGFDVEKFGVEESYYGRLIYDVEQKYSNADVQGMTLFNGRPAVYIANRNRIILNAAGSPISTDVSFIQGMAVDSRGAIASQTYFYLIEQVGVNCSIRVYRVSDGARQSSRDFNVFANRTFTGLTYVKSKNALYALDAESGVMRVYSLDSSQYGTALNTSFQLGTGKYLGWAGLANDDEFLYVLDSGAVGVDTGFAKIRVYEIDGTRRTDRDFNLRNGRFSSITVDPVRKVLYALDNGNPTFIARGEPRVDTRSFIERLFGPRLTPRSTQVVVTGRDATVSSWGLK